MADSRKKPVLWLIAGINGAGKTTFYYRRLQPSVCAPFVNADEIAKERWPDDPSAHAYDAAKLAHARRDELIREGRSFVAETVFSHPSKVDLIERAQAAGFRVHLIHINVRSPDLAVRRVGVRVRRGGHDVPEDKVRSRYPRTQQNILRAVEAADRSTIYDNSLYGHRHVMTLERGQVRAMAHDVPKWARDLFADKLRQFSLSRLNPAALSFQEARELTRSLLGEQAETRIARRGREYHGTIIAESSLHTVQAIGQHEAVAHFTGALSPAPAIGQRVRVAYDAKRHRARVRECPPG